MSSVKFELGEGDSVEGGDDYEDEDQITELNLSAATMKNKKLNTKAFSESNLFSAMGDDTGSVGGSTKSLRSGKRPSVLRRSRYGSMLFNQVTGEEESTVENGASVATSERRMVNAGKLRREEQVQRAMSMQDKKLENKLNDEAYSSVKDPLFRNHHRIDPTSLDSMKSIIDPVKQSSRTNKRATQIAFIFSVFTSFFSVYRLAFDNDNTTLRSVDLTLDMYFCLYLLFQAFHVVPPHLLSAHVMEEPPHVNLRIKVFLEYTRRWRCIPDFLSSLPWDFIAFAIFPNISKVTIFVLGLMRVGRLFKVYDFFSRAEVNIRYPYILTRFSIFLLILLLQAHWFGSFFYFVAKNEADTSVTWLQLVADSKPQGLPTSPAELYLTSLYWAVVTVSTVGYGDINPTSRTEFIVIICFLICDTFLTAHLIGNMTVLVTTSDEHTRIFRKKFAELEKYMQANLLPKDIRDTMRAHRVLQFNVAKEHREALDEFPAVFRARIQRLLYRPIVELSFFGDVASDAFIDTLSCLLTVEMFMPETDAVSQGDAAFEMFFVVSGIAEVLLINEAPGALQQMQDQKQKEEEEEEEEEEEAEAERRNKAGKEGEEDREEETGFGGGGGGGGGGGVGGRGTAVSNSNSSSAENSNIDAAIDILQRDESASWDLLASPAAKYNIAVAERTAADDEDDNRANGSNNFNDGLPARNCNEVANGESKGSSPGGGDSPRQFASILKQMSFPDNDVEDDDYTTVCSVGKGECFGEVSFLFNLLQPFTVRTQSICRMLSMKRTEWDVLRASYPRDTQIVQQATAEDLGLLVARSEDNPRLQAVYSHYEGLVENVLQQNENDKVTELCFAAASSNIFALRQGLVAGLDINMGDYDNRTALHIAAGVGSTVSVTFLLNEGADPNCVDAFGNTPLFEAVKKGRDEAAEILYARGAELGIRDVHDGRAINGSPSGTFKQFTKFHRHSVSDLKVANHAQRDAGSIACEVAARGEVDYMKRLLRFGLPAAASDYDGRSGLHLAAAKGHHIMVEMLLNHGANPNALDNFGRTPLLEAVRNGQEPIARLLRSFGAELGFVVTAATTPTKSENDALDRSRVHAGAELCQAVYDGNMDYLRLLLAFGCPANAADYDLRTAAHLSCAENLFEAAMLLHRYGADFGGAQAGTRGILDRWGHSPVQDALLNHHHELAAVLNTLPAPPKNPVPPPPPHPWLSGSSSPLPGSVSGGGIGQGGGLGGGGGVGIDTPSGNNNTAADMAETTRRESIASTGSGSGGSAGAGVGGGGTVSRRGSWRGISPTRGSLGSSSSNTPISLSRNNSNRNINVSRSNSGARLSRSNSGSRSIPPGSPPPANRKRFFERDFPFG